jgi:hypothetical protein
MEGSEYTGKKRPRGTEMKIVNLTEYSLFILTAPEGNILYILPAEPTDSSLQVIDPDRELTIPGKLTPVEKF